MDPSNMVDASASARMGGSESSARRDVCEPALLAGASFPFLLSPLGFFLLADSP